MCLGKYINFIKTTKRFYHNNNIFFPNLIKLRKLFFFVVVKQFSGFDSGIEIEYFWYLKICLYRLPKMIEDIIYEKTEALQNTLVTRGFNKNTSDL